MKQKLRILDLADGGPAVWTIMVNHGPSVSYGYSFYFSREDVELKIDSLCEKDKLGTITSIRATGWTADPDTIEALKSIWDGDQDA